MLEILKQYPEEFGSKSTKRMPIFTPDVILGGAYTFLCFVSVIVIFKLPCTPLYRLLPQPIQIEIPDNPGDLLPAEQKHTAQFPTLASFRGESYSMDKALQEYHCSPIAYALGLAEVSVELCDVVRQRDSTRYEELVTSEKFQRQRRDYFEEGDLSAGDLTETPKLVTPFQYFLDHKRRLRNRGNINTNQRVNDALLRSRSRSYLPLATQDIELDTESSEVRDRGSPVSVDWMSELTRFRKNLNCLCRYAGSEVDELAMPRETINNLRKFASDRKQELAPLFEENARLNSGLTSYKRINAALQIRRTIEKLTFELPETSRYDLPGSGPKWRRLWDDIWQNAGINPSNPFHKLWKDAGGDYARNNYRDKGRELFADMSSEIHGYDKRDFDYEHFDASTRGIANVLRPEIVNEKTGEVDWAKEVRKYPVNWPTSYNLTLTKVQRLKANLDVARRRATKLETDLLDAQEEEERLENSGATTREEREANRQANEEQDCDIEGMFGDD